MLPYAQSGLRLQAVRLVPRYLGQGGAPFPPTPPPITPPVVPPTPYQQLVDILPKKQDIAQVVAGAANLGIAIGLGYTVVSAGASWVGIHTGIKEKGFLSFTGWTVGILAGLSSLLTLTTVAGLGVIAGSAKAVANQA
jgi:hypothetical protein